MSEPVFVRVEIVCPTCNNNSYVSVLIPENISSDKVQEYIEKRLEFYSICHICNDRFLASSNFTIDK